MLGSRGAGRVATALRDAVEPAWQAGLDLAAMYRAAAMLGLDAGIDNHCTLMLPGSDRLFLSHEYGLHFSDRTQPDYAR